MDYVDFDTFIDTEALPSPQPSLSIPLKSNIENLGSRLPQLNNLKQFLQLNKSPVPELTSADTKLAEKYARLSLDQLSNDPKPPVIKEVEDLSTRSDALSERLARGLNPSFGDASMRELFVRLEDKNQDEDLDLLVDAGIVGSIARKNLRTQVEAELLKSYSSILADYTKSVKTLKTLGDRISALVVSVNDTKDLLEKDVASTAEFMKSVETLNSQKKSVDLKKNLLVAFRQKFTLSEYEQFVLEFNDISEEFFETLQRAEKINEDCLVLLSLDNPQQGQKLLAKNNEIVRKAIQKIVNFSQRSLSNIYSLNNKERLNTLHLCLIYLGKTPSQLNVVLDSFVKTRSASLLEDFSSQLHGKDHAEMNSNSDSRPVFYSSHDPIRYIADILAYVHSIVANEVETVKNLFESESGLLSTASHILELVLGSLAKPIKTEIDRIVSAETKLQTMYQIFSHLDLYHLMFKKIPDASGINVAITNAKTFAKDKIELILSNRLVAAKTSNLARLDLSSDLQPPEWMIDFYTDVIAIADSMTYSTFLDLPHDEHEKFLNLIINKPISVFQEHLSLESASFSKRDIIIFKLNCLDLIISKITPVTILNSKIQELNELTDSLCSEAKALQLQELLQNCSLTDFFNVTNMIFPIDKQLLDPSIYQAITENRLFTKEIVMAANEEIQMILPTALMDTQSALLKLNNPIIVKNIITQTFDEFAVFYKLFSDIVIENLKEPLFTWSYEEVATMLGIYENDLY